MAGPSAVEPPTPPTPPTLPTVWRPGFARWTAYGVGAFLVAFFLFVMLAVDVPWSNLIMTVQRVGLFLVATATAVVMWRFGRVRIEADDAGITVVNPLHRRRLEWAEVVSVRLASGDPWVQLDLSDGSTAAALAIQTADGARGRRMAGELAACVAARSGQEPEPR